MLDSTYHVFPTNDLKEHLLKAFYPVVGDPYCPCECNPRLQVEENGLIFIHNSFDGREGVEWVNEILA